MKNYKRAIALFEVSFVVLLVSIISVFIFRGYRIFIKTSKKSSDYLNLIRFSEDKFWDLQMQQAREGFSEDDIDTSGISDDGRYEWNLDLNSSESSNITALHLQTSSRKPGSKTVFDSILYLEVELSK